MSESPKVERTLFGDPYVPPRLVRINLLSERFTDDYFRDRCQVSMDRDNIIKLIVFGFGGPDFKTFARKVGPWRVVGE